MIARNTALGAYHAADFRKRACGRESAHRDLLGERNANRGADRSPGFCLPLVLLVVLLAFDERV